MKRTPVVLAALAATAALAFAGCGGDDEDEPEALTGATGAEAVDIASKEDFIAAADAICAEQEETGQADIQVALGGETTPTEDQQIEIAETIVIPNLQNQHDLIADLPQPEGEEDEINDLLDELQAGIDAAEDDPEALVTAADGGPLAEAGAAATDYGLTECGS